MWFSCYFFGATLVTTLDGRDDENQFFSLLMTWNVAEFPSFDDGQISYNPEYIISLQMCYK